MQETASSHGGDLLSEHKVSVLPPRWTKPPSLLQHGEEGAMLEASVLLLSDCSGSLTHSYLTFEARVLPVLHSFTPLQRDTDWWDNPAACWSARPFGPGGWMGYQWSFHCQSLCHRCLCRFSIRVIQLSSLQ